MMEADNLTINFFPIEIVGAHIPIYVTSQKPASPHRTLLGKRLSRLLDAGTIKEGEIYWSFHELSNSRKASIDSKRDYEITKQYINELLFRHFEAIDGILLKWNFIGGIKVYEKDGAEASSGYTLQKLNEFSIRCEYWHIDGSPRFGVIVAKSAVTQHTAQPYSELKNHVPIERVNRVVFGNKVGSYDNFKNEPGFTDSAVYLMRSYWLKDIFPFRKGFKKQNPYPAFHSAIISLVKRHLFEKTVEGFVRFPHSTLMAVPRRDIFKTSRESNLLSFRDEQKSPNVYNGLKEYGPYFVPENAEKVKFVFFFHKDDKEEANKFIAYCSKGYRGFPGFGQFVGIPLTPAQIDKGKTIQYSDINPADEIIRQIKGMDFTDGKYVAIYLSRIHRDEADDDKRAAYFKIKEALLHKGVISQVIYKQNINNSYFNFFLPNIAIALLAKLSGIPWKLAHPAVPNLIVGVGASRENDSLFIGNTICFKNDGTFEEFDAFAESSVAPLGNSFKNTIQQYVQAHGDVKRLVIHFYKQMNHEEERELLHILSDLDISIPYVVLTITDDAGKDYVLFDEDYDGLMPVSGTYVRVSRNTYILANNERYQKSAILKINDFPFSVKIAFSKWKDVDLENPDVVKELIYQVYQFSRIYWRSIRQKSKPVTILYSEYIAKMARRFQDGKIPENLVSRKSLWFL